MTDHYKAGDEFPDVGASLSEDGALIANAARQEAFAEIDAAAFAAAENGAASFKAWRPVHSDKWGLHVGGGLITHGLTFTAALLAASKGEGDESE